ncbi:hypothetical protein [Salsipaludibacter albus]|uniref:hypothetical protein n=1 Tax=Salsipaludibacter albus TaxID=2849650 RepID=UPI001EE4384B|nr:hypothetical protein [Salsipaludibacter albus]MBY5163572.1 hypothetical protein [Salsipaludibacter albus]
MSTQSQTSNRTATPGAGDRSGVLRAAGVMAAGGVTFMIPVIGFPGIHANFEEDPAARLAGLEAHYTNYLVGSVLLSLGWLLMGIGLFLLCRRLAELESDWTATVLRVTGTVLLVPFLVLTLVYLVPEAWSLTAAEWAAAGDEPEPGWLSALQLAVTGVILVGWMIVSTILARSRHWPTWLGVVFGILGLATIVTQLPLFAAIGAIVLGATVWRESRRRDVAGLT